VKLSGATAVGRNLVWVFLLAFLFVPMTLSQGTFENWTYDPWPARLFEVVIAGVVAFLAIRYLARLFRAPRNEASRESVLLQFGAGLLLALLSTGPLLESNRWSTKPEGAVTALIGAALLALGLRDAFRLRTD
jgi:hypothetical protein